VWWGDTDACKVLKSLKIMALSLGIGENVFFILSSSTLTPYYDTLGSQRSVVAVQIHVLRLQTQFGCAEAVGLLQLASELSAYLMSCIPLVHGR
jgi:hypothetical protein